MGQNCRFLNRLDPEQEQIKEIREAIAHREPLRITLRNFRQDGTVFWNNLIINPIRDHTGRTTHFVGIVSDISSEVLHQQQMGICWSGSSMRMRILKQRCGSALVSLRRPTRNFVIRH